MNLYLANDKSDYIFMDALLYVKGEEKKELEKLLLEDYHIPTEEELFQFIMDTENDDPDVLENIESENLIAQMI